MEQKCSKSKCVPLFPSHSLSCCLWDFAPICLRGSAATSYGSAFIQTSECLCGTARCPRLVKNKPKMCDLWLPWWCGGERGGRTEVTGLHTGAKMQLTLLTGPLSDGLMFVHYLPPTAAAIVSLPCKDVQIIEHSSADMPKLITHRIYLTTFKTHSLCSIYGATLKDSEGQVWGLKHHLLLKMDI